MARHNEHFDLKIKSYLDTNNFFLNNFSFPKWNQPSLDSYDDEFTSDFQEVENDASIPDIPGKILFVVLPVYILKYNFPEI